MAVDSTSSEPTRSVDTTGGDVEAEDDVSVRARLVAGSTIEQDAESAGWSGLMGMVRTHTAAITLNSPGRVYCCVHPKMHEAQLPKCQGHLCQGSCGGNPASVWFMHV